MESKNIFRERLNKINPEIKKTIDLSVSIANRIYDILDTQKLSQKDFAKKIGKSEAEISRWMQGTHNFTLKTLAKIEVALNEPIVSAFQKKETNPFRSGTTISRNDFSNFSRRHVGNSVIKYSGRNSKSFNCSTSNYKNENNYRSC